MLELPPKFILFDTEYTAWEGSQERKWGGPNEYREIVQIGAIYVDNVTLTEINAFTCFIQPKMNPVLSDYFINLTGITQGVVDTEGVGFFEAIARFKEWSMETPIYSFGRDGRWVQENCTMLMIQNPFTLEQFHNIRDFFKIHGISTDQYFSSTIIEAFGKVALRRGHDALNDVRTILDGLHALNDCIDSKN